MSAARLGAAAALAAIALAALALRSIGFETVFTPDGVAFAVFDGGDPAGGGPGVRQQG